MVWASGQNVSLGGGVLACPAGRSLRNRSRIHWRENINNPAVSETKLKDEGEVGSGLSATKTEDEYGKAAAMSSQKVTKKIKIPLPSY